MNDRATRIIEFLNQHGELTVEELSVLLGVSPSSIRRDLSSLSDQRFVERTRGGARLSTVICYDPLPIYKLPVDPGEARAIAGEAVRLIQRGDVIGLSGGRICTELALRLRILEGITVVTNAVNVGTELVGLPGIRVMLTGGRLSPGSFELVGQAVGLSLNGVHIHKFFLGIHGLSLQHGATAHDEAEALASRVIMEHAGATFILANSSKFKQANFAQVSPISDIDAIVTTDRVPQDVRDRFEKAGVRMIIAPCS